MKIDTPFKTRRHFLRDSIVAASGMILLPGCGDQTTNSRAIATSPDIGVSDRDTTWRAQAVIDALKAPLIPAKEYPLSSSELAAKEDCAALINEQIKRCHESGGGRVIVPEGVHRTGAIHMRSKVELHLEAGAELSFISDPARYLPAVLSRWEGMALWNYSPLIYAIDCEDIAVTGAGIINGNADDQTWWPWKGAHSSAHWDVLTGVSQKPARDRLQAQVEQALPVEERRYGDGDYLRPPMVQFMHSRRILIEGVTLKNAPFWLIHPVLCEDVTIRRVTCISHGPNSDGCDPESCDRVLIESCVFDTGDDCIAIKSGRNDDGRRVATPSQNIVVRDCVMRAGHGGVVVGSEISGGVRNVFVERCEMSSPDLERAIRIKTNSVRGGLLENLHYRNIDVGVVQDFLVINFYYEEGDKGPYDPVVRDIFLSDFRVGSAQRVFQVRGFQRAPIQNLKLTNIHIENAGEIGIVENVQGLALAAVRAGRNEILPSDFPNGVSPSEGSV